MRELNYNKISKLDFQQLNEDNIMFITNPGRMGDEDGSTFVVKNGNIFTIYRVSGWMYSSKEDRDSEDYISLGDASKQFPKWMETWEHWNDKNYQGKYKYLYMGFGNGLCVDNSIYDEFKPYLDSLSEKYLEDMKYAVIINVWENALMEMVKDKKYVIK